MDNYEVAKKRIQEWIEENKTKTKKILPYTDCMFLYFIYLNIYIIFFKNQ
jgi:hypothetical protein